MKKVIYESITLIKVGAVQFLIDMEICTDIHL